MIPTPNSSSSIYPTEWHPINVLLDTECRQLTDDTFQLRSASHTVTVDKEGFDLYRSNVNDFENWLEAKGIHDIPRTDV